MNRITHAAVRHPWMVVLLWLVAIVGAGFLTRIAGAPSSSPQGLPPSAESQVAAAVASRSFGTPDQQATASIVVADGNGLSSGDEAAIARLSAWLTSEPDVLRVGSAVPSQDGQAVILPVTFSKSGAPLEGDVSDIEAHLDAIATGGLRASLTGEQVVTHDLAASATGQGAGGGFNPMRLATLVVILVILAFVFRAPLAVAVPLLSIGASLLVSIRLLPVVTGLLHLPYSAFTEPFAVAVTLGAGSNYGLFLISRYREALRAGRRGAAALEDAVDEVGHAVFFSAGTVIVATGLMAFAQLDLFRSLGPAVGVSVAVMLVSGLTLMPALARICGRALFWPLQVRPATGGRGFWARTALATTEHPIVAVALGAALLAPLALAVGGLDPSFDTVRSLPTGTPSAEAYALLEQHFPTRLATADILITGPEPLAGQGAELARVTTSLSREPLVSSVGQARLSADGRTARIPASIAADPASSAAMDAAVALPTETHAILVGTPLSDDSVLVGGPAAANADERSLLGSDFRLMAVIVGVAIYAILALLLTDLLAPVYLLGSVVISSLAAMGAVVLVDRFLNQPVFWTTPVFAFVFLVALGEDFNILLMNRMRREIGRHGLSAGIVEAVGKTGGVISSCGLVMAAAFLLLARSDVLIVQQIGLVVIIGILLDTFAVRPIIVPAIVRLLGNRSRFVPRLDPRTVQAPPS